MIIQIILCLGLIGATLELGMGFQLINWYTKKILNLKISHLDDDPKFKAALHQDQFIKVANLEVKFVYYVVITFHGLLLVISAATLIYLALHNVLNLYPLAIVIILYAVYDWYRSTKPIKQHKRIPNYYEDQFKNESRE